MGAQTSLVDENVRVGCESSDETHHVLVDGICLFAGLGGSQQLGNNLLLSCKHHTVRGQQRQTRASVVDRLDGVLYLMQTTCKNTIRSA